MMPAISFRPSLPTMIRCASVVLFVISALSHKQAHAANCEAADEESVEPATFLKTYCVGCHSTADPSGERDFEMLDLNDSSVDNQLALQEIIDQLTLRTMPPDDGDQPSTDARLGAIAAMTGRLTTMRQQTSSTGGRTVLRRLSRREYRRTVGDLLAIDMTMFDPTLEFPADNMISHFDNIGDALVTSGHLLEFYLDAADKCLEKALALRDSPNTGEWVFRDNFFQQPELAPSHRKAFNNRYICLYDHPLNEKPEGAYGYVSEFRSGVPVDGVYEVRVLAKAMNRDTPYGERTVRIDLTEPFRMGIRPGDTSLGDMYHTQPIQPKLAEAVIFDDDFKWYRFRIPLDRGFAPRFTFENGIHDVRGSFGRVFRFHKDTLPPAVHYETGIARQRVAVIDQGKIPHIRISEVQIRGPIEFAWPTPSQQALIGGARFDAANPLELIQRFASRAYRRPATLQEIQGLTALYRSRLDEGHTAEQAFRDTLKSVLCSPAFLYFQQPFAASGGMLSDHGLAERLSYFLTSTTPDDHLRGLADRGEISNPDVLRKVVKRLLASEACGNFVADFLDNWLDLRSLGTMPPDPDRYWFFYAAGLADEMKVETRMYLRDLIDRDASAVELLSGNYSFVNRDLAKLYGIADQVPADSANEFRRVTFNDQLRGGLLGQASILTVSANGIETSPVVRGVWLLENILGTPTPPPPDNVPAIEPDTRGATTIRDQLTRHRDNAACFQCHRKIDPLGFALESFDPIGQSRSFYDEKRKQPIDTSGTLPGGGSFSNVAELKQCMIERKAFFVRTLTERLLMHALGRRIEPVDRAAVDSILIGVQAENYPMASLLEAIVLSELFRK